MRLFPRRDRLLSEAIVVYCRKGRSPFPSADPAAVRALLPSAGGDALLERVCAIEREMFTIEVDWEGLGWLPGTDHVVETMRSRHPELSARAIDALDWNYSYSTR